MGARLRCGGDAAGTEGSPAMDALIGGPVDAAISSARRMAAAGLSAGDLSAPASRIDAGCRQYVVAGARPCDATGQIRQQPVTNSTSYVRTGVCHELMSVTVLGMGTAMPPHSIAQDDAAELAKAFYGRTDEYVRLLPMLYKRTQIRRRWSVLLEDAKGSGLQPSFFSPAVGDADHGPSTEQRMPRYAKEAAPLALIAARRALAESRLATG